MVSDYLHKPISKLTLVHHCLCMGPTVWQAGSA